MMRKPWMVPLLVGGVLRLVSALVGYGYFASDDYRYALEPAWNLVMYGTRAPASGIRSVIFARIVAVGMQLTHWLGVQDPAWLIRATYLFLGAISLVAIPGVYRLTLPRLGERAALCATWLMACEALMPRIATRALIEVAAIPALVWGLVFVLRAIDRSSGRDALVAGALLGLAGMLRYQVGIVAVCAVAYCVYVRAFKAALLMTAAGFMALVAQGFLDLVTHGRFLATLLGYVAFNAERSSGFGEAPWFTYLVMLALVTIPPLTFWLARPLWRASRAHPLVSVALVVFVIAHSAIPHKEERFLFSVLPLVFVLLGAALLEVPRWAQRAFWAVNCVVLLVATLSDGQHSIIDPLRDAKADRIVLVGGFEAPALYARGIPITRYMTPEALQVTSERQRFITYADRAPLVIPETLTCAPPRVYTGDLVDQLLLAVNPKGNKRRSAKVVLDCAP